MSDTPAPRLTGDQIIALRFAAHRQLARWSSTHKLGPHQHAQRTELRRAVHVLHDDACVDRCELRLRLRPLTTENHADA